MTEFNLSEEIKWDREELLDNTEGHIHTEDVKEFIRLLKDKLKECEFKNVIDRSGYPTEANASQIIQNFLDFAKEMDKLVGEKLL